MADTSYDRLIWTISIACALLLFVASPASAQQQSEGYGSDTPSGSNQGSEVGLPSWAEPRESPLSGQNPSPTPAQADSEPVLPGPPSQVPVDGGLALLAAAGAGYAVRRLKKSSDEEPSEPVA